MSSVEPRGNCASGPRVRSPAPRPASPPMPAPMPAPLAPAAIAPMPAPVTVVVATVPTSFPLPPGPVTFPSGSIVSLPPESALRVAAGTVTLSFAPMRLSVTGRAAGATGGAADACGPSGCCAKAKLDEPSTKRGRTKSERVRFTAIPPCCHAMRPAQLRMPVVYAGSAYQRANPFKRWHLTTRFVRSTLMAVAGGRHGEIGARLRDAIAAGGRSRRSEGRHSSAEERAHGPRHHALDCGQQGGNRVDLPSVDRSLLRYVSGDLEGCVSAIPEIFRVHARIAQCVGDEHRRLSGQLKTFAALIASHQVIQAHHVRSGLGKFL